MNRWHWNRLAARDFGLTVTGLVIVWAQLLLWAFRERAADPVLTAIGLALLFPAARAHVRTVLNAPEAGQSSESSPPPSSPPSLPPSSPQPEEASGT